MCNSAVGRRVMYYKAVTLPGKEKFDNQLFPLFILAPASRLNGPVRLSAAFSTNTIGDTYNPPLFPPKRAYN